MPAKRKAPHSEAATVTATSKRQHTQRSSPASSETTKKASAADVTIDTKKTKVTQSSSQEGKTATAVRVPSLEEVLVGAKDLNVIVLQPGVEPSAGSGRDDIKLSAMPKEMSTGSVASRSAFEQI
ncbi:hypothetical protein I317_07392 [Kwoniella heveanensis CBS 569]|nr:hypothetical protein I317_07392 [Kwoniella heveanensis CBS 569]